VAQPLRIRHSPERWSGGRVESALFRSLDDNIGARMSQPWFKPPEGWGARRFDMDNGDVALFAWNGSDAYWIGNTETPSALWRTEKYTFEQVPDDIEEWIERELLAQLHEGAPWLADYPTLSWFFLPVFLSKDGRETSRDFFSEHAAGFPDASAEEALSFYESFLASGVLDAHRYTMASKLGTSERLDDFRMAATMSEFNAAWLLSDAGYEVTPEVEVTTGHSIDFRADPGGVLVEVTRPRPPSRRAANSPVAAVRDTAETKTSGQLSAHAGGVVLFVDCSSFPDDAWASVLGEQPEVRHRPAVVFRLRPDGRVEGYTKGSVPLDLPNLKLR